MTRAWRSLRVRLAVLGFLAMYLPALLLFGVSVTETELSWTENGREVTTDSTGRDLAWSTWTMAVLAPVAAGLAWWLSGRAVRPIDRVRAVAEEIEGSDLHRRIGLDRGPTEIVALAASFDAMLDRLEAAAETQRRLVEETSHELRTPLAVLSTNADVLLAHPEPTVDVYRQGLERSKAASARLLATIDELLVDARGRARIIDRRPADLVAIARDVVEDTRVLADSRGIDVLVSGRESIACSLDAPTVTRAAVNLVDNAIRHAPAGTTVEIDVAATDREASITVTDHGPGLPADQQDRVFERFWRGRSDTAGTGLGLPIARQIALAHGGDLTVRSPGPAGDGCAFTLRLRR